MKNYAKKIKETVYKNIGIPVCVGIAQTKTLAKVANKIAKKQNGVFTIDSERVRDWALRNTSIDDVWGIGRQFTKKLLKMGINTAYDFTLQDSAWISQKHVS